MKGPAGAAGYYRGACSARSTPERPDRLSADSDTELTSLPANPIIPTASVRKRGYALSASSHRNTLTRQWEILQLIPSRAPGITCSELYKKIVAAGFKVTRRTIERDLNDLSKPFALQCNDKGTPQGWHWSDGASVNLPGISVGEALSLALIENAIRPLLPSGMLQVLEPRFRFARQKLESLAECNQTLRWLDKVACVHPDLNLQPPQVPADILETLHEALLQEKQLRCRYYSAHNDKERELVLNPLALVQRGPVAYLICTSPPYDDIRQYATHRFRQTEILPSATEGLAHFDLQAYLASDALQFGTPDKLQLQAWISDNLARLLRETPLSPDMTLEKLSNGYRLRATMSDTWQLQWWILSQSDALVVESPPALRARIAEKFRQSASRYESESLEEACP